MGGRNGWKKINRSKNTTKKKYTTKKAAVTEKAMTPTMPVPSEKETKIDKAGTRHKTGILSKKDTVDKFKNKIGKRKSTKKKREQKNKNTGALYHFKSFFVDISESLNKKWFLKSLLIVFPGIWTQIFCNIFGKDLGLRDAQKNSTTLGTVFTIIIYVLSAVVTFSTAFKACRDLIRQANKINEDKQLEGIIDAKTAMIDIMENLLCEEKESEMSRVTSLRKVFEKESELTTSIGLFVNETFRPRDHLAEIMESMKNGLIKIYETENKHKKNKLKKDNLRVSMLVKLPNKKWDWVDRREIDACANLKMLMDDKRSTFNAVLAEDAKDGVEKIYKYYNDKEIGIEKGHYVPDTLDIANKKKGRIVGSILCWRIDFPIDNDRMIQGVISFSTYGHKFFDSNKKSVLDQFYREMFRDKILMQFEHEIKIDMALDYICSICKSKSEK